MIAHARTLLAAGLAAALLSPPAIAMDAHSRVRLIDGGAAEGKVLAGIEITLDPGWKTYWRMPGEAGVPPQFDWSRSGNAEAVEVGYPAPHRFMDSGGEAIGYKGQVVFPLSIRPKDADKPVELDLTLHYAVCNDICIPAKADLKGLVGASSAAEAALVHDTAALVPTEQAPGLDVVSARLDGEGKDTRLVVTLKGERAGGDVDIFVEGFDDAYFRAPEALPPDAAGRRLGLGIDGLKDRAALLGRMLTLTVIAPDARLVRQVPVE